MAKIKRSIVPEQPVPIVPRRPSSGCSRPAEKRADKAPEKTVEGLRRVGVVLYDVDPDQLACIAGGQQATSLHGHCGCPNGCNQ
jgi:hypothetical protein